jgi:hypothetical protein
MELLSLKSGSAFCTVKSVPRTLRVEGLVEVFFGDWFQCGELALAGAGKKDIDLALFVLNGFVQAVEIREVGGVNLDAGDVLSDELHSFIKLVLAASRDEDLRTLLNEELCGRKRHAGRPGDDLPRQHSLGESLKVSIY